MNTVHLIIYKKTQLFPLILQKFYIFSSIFPNINS